MKSNTLKLLGACVQRVGTLALILPTFLLVLHADAAAPAQFNVAKHGATGDGVTLDTGGLQKAIDACAAAVGGHVVFPKGTYLAGSLELKSGVHLVLTREAVLLGSSSLKDYSNLKLIYAAHSTGTHTLQIRNRESGTRIDAVVLVRTDLEFDPLRHLTRGLNVATE